MPSPLRDDGMTSIATVLLDTVRSPNAIPCPARIMANNKSVPANRYPPKKKEKSEIADKQQFFTGKGIDHIPGERTYHQRRDGIGRQYESCRRTACCERFAQIHGQNRQQQIKSKKKAGNSRQPPHRSYVSTISHEQPFPSTFFILFKRLAQQSGRRCIVHFYPDKLSYAMTTFIENNNLILRCATEQLFARTF